MKHAHDSHYVYIEPFRSPFPFLFFLGVVVVVIALAADWLNGLPVQIVGPGSLSHRALIERGLLSGRADAAASERLGAAGAPSDARALRRGLYCRPRNVSGGSTDAPALRGAALMRALLSLSLAAGLVLLPATASPGSFTPDPERWRPVAYSDLRLPRGEAESYASIWQDRLDESNSKPPPAPVPGRPLPDPSLSYAVGNRGASEWHFTINFQTKLAALTVLDTPHVCTDEYPSPVGRREDQGLSRCGSPCSRRIATRS